jgi:hypothetical protein
MKSSCDLWWFCWCCLIRKTPFLQDQPQHLSAFRISATLNHYIGMKNHRVQNCMISITGLTHTP